jgi:restriction endonuclease
VFPVIAVNVAGSRWSRRYTNISELSLGINFQEQAFVVALEPEVRGVSQFQ